MVRYGCAKTDSGGVECFVEFSEATTLLDSISSRCRSFQTHCRVEGAKAATEQRKIPPFRNASGSRIPIPRGEQEKRKEKRVESLSFRPLETFLSFFSTDILIIKSRVDISRELDRFEIAAGEF